MKRIVAVTAGMVCLLLALTGQAAAPEAITDPQAPLVKQLEDRFASSLAAAREGDVDAYWSHRTVASRIRPPMLDRMRLKMLAELLPPLDTLQFVRLDANDKIARALYRWHKPGTAQYTVIVYRVEQGEWRIDDFTVRRSVTAPPERRTLSEASLPQQPETLTVPAPSLEAPRP